MKKLKFDYVKIGPHKRPIIPVRLTYENQSVNTPALIDSGADFNVFPLSIAKDIGLKLNMNKPIVFGGVGEKNQKLTGYLGVLNLMIYKKGNSFQFLGEAGFFDHLSEVSFYYKRGKVILQDKIN